MLFGEKKNKPIYLLAMRFYNVRNSNFIIVLSTIAITISLIVLIGSLIFWFWFRNSSSTLTHHTEMDISVKTTDDIRKEVLLGDNSKIWVNANSTLQYGNDYKTDRKIGLSGEAYFKIKESNHPFTLTTETVNVLLNSGVFLIEDFEDKNTLKVTLYDGIAKLLIKGAKQEVLLNAGTTLVFDEKKQTLEMSNVKAGTYGPNWIINKFEYTPFINVLYSLSDYYDISVTNQKPELNNEPYTLIIEGDKTLDEVMMILQAISKQFSYRIVGKELIIH